jgi:hypothetical protein
MKSLSNALSLAAASVCFALAPAASAQQLELPRPSPNAKLTQTVGLTDITVEYSSPGVKKRPIWGALVPYDQVWRAGANAATRITFNKEVSVGETPVPAGSYSFFVIPAKTGPWTLVLNKNDKAATREYKVEQDVLRLKVKPEAISHRERLAYVISNFSDDAASLDLEWEKVRVSLPIKLKTSEQALANIKGVSESTWRPYNSAARYMLETKKDYDAGLELIERSLSIKEDWQNDWTKASLLAAKGDFKAAYSLAEKANSLGEKAEFFFAADEVKKALTEWKSKIH